MADERDAGASIEDGIEAAQAGDLGAVMTALDDGERIAREADIAALVAAARINKGLGHR